MSFGDASLPQLSVRASSQFEVQTAFRVIRQVGLVPWDEEPRRQAVTCDEDGVLGAEQRRRTVAKGPQRRYLQVVTSVTTISVSQSRCHRMKPRRPESAR